MKNTNIGITNLVISNKLKLSHFNDQSLDESKKLAFDLLNIVKNSPILQLEFKVFNNIENKHIENEILAKDYIDNHIKLFEVYTIEEIDAERQKLSPFLTEGTIDDNSEKVELYNAIDALITESINLNEDVDVDNIHEAFTVVFNHIKSPKKALLENVDVEPMNEDVIEIAVGKFNEKYAGLNESDRELLKTLIKANAKEKKALLETYKAETLTMLEGINKENVQDNIAKAIQKIKEMVYDRKNVDDNIIGLHEFKKEML